MKIKLSLLTIAFVLNNFFRLGGCLTDIAYGMAPPSPGVQGQNSGLSGFFPLILVFIVVLVFIIGYFFLILRQNPPPNVQLTLELAEKLQHLPAFPVKKAIRIEREFAVWSFLLTLSLCLRFH